MKNVGAGASVGDGVRVQDASQEREELYMKVIPHKMNDPRTDDNFVSTRVGGWDIKPSEAQIIETPKDFIIFPAEQAHAIVM